MLKNLIQYITKLLIQPFIRHEICRMNSYSGINTGNLRDIPVIVSLTSTRSRFGLLQISLFSLLNQTFKPDKIILWLDEETEDMTTLPYEITGFIKNGLEIRFVKSIKSYTKTIYALKNYSDSIVVTADDNVYYRKDWLRKLYLSYIASPKDVHVHRAYEVSLSDDGKSLFFGEDWSPPVKYESACYSNFLSGDGGILYPPKCFGSEYLREDIFLKNSPFSDDLWFWVMALVHNKKIRVVKEHYNYFLKCCTCKNILKNYEQNFPDNVEIRALMKFYGQNIINRLNEETQYQNNSTL